MKRKMKIFTFLIVLISSFFIKKVAFANNISDIEITQSDNYMQISSNKQTLILQVGKEIEIITDSKTYKYPNDSKYNSKKLEYLYYELLDGEMIKEENKTIIRNGKLFIDTNLLDIIIDEDKMFFQEKNKYFFRISKSNRIRRLF